MEPTTTNRQPEPVPAAATATQYVDQELTLARRRLKRARIGAAVTVLFVCGYMTFLTVLLGTQLLQPKPAADWVTMYTSRMVAENGPAVQERLLTEVPAMIRQLPEVAIQKLPELRLKIETQYEAALAEQCQRLVPELGAMLDTYLADNKDRVHELLLAAKDPHMVELLGQQLEDEARTWLNTKGADGESATDKLNESLAALRQVELRLRRLATAQDLTPQELQLRRAIALLMHTAKRASAGNLEARNTTGTPVAAVGGDLHAAVR